MGQVLSTFSMAMFVSLVGNRERGGGEGDRHWMKIVGEGNGGKRELLAVWSV